MSMATPTVPITLPSMLYNGDLYVVSRRVPSPVCTVSSATQVVPVAMTFSSDSMHAGSSCSTSHM